MPINAQILEWSLIHKEANRKWGIAQSLSELEVMIKKTLEDKRHVSVFQQFLLTKNVRPYKIACVLPTKIGDCINADIIIKKEIKKSINGGGVHFGNGNENLIKSSFPGLYQSVVKTFIEETQEEFLLSN